jgi:hypothetical protein
MNLQAMYTLNAWVWEFWKNRSLHNNKNDQIKNVNELKSAPLLITMWIGDCRYTQDITQCKLETEQITVTVWDGLYPSDHDCSILNVVGIGMCSKERDIFRSSVTFDLHARGMMGVEGCSGEKVRPSYQVGCRVAFTYNSTPSIWSSQSLITMAVRSQSDNILHSCEHFGQQGNMTTVLQTTDHVDSVGVLTCKITEVRLYNAPYM